MEKFSERLVTPELRLIVSAEGDAAELTIAWHINEADASCWRRPMSISIQPFKPLQPKDSWRDDFWETHLELSREDARLVRDFLSSLLRSPDLREEEK